CQQHSNGPQLTC
nr:immunoglobulin light chain junction region [Macaca mulatta]